jgi:hypothetical protein
MNVVPPSLLLYPENGRQVVLPRRLQDITSLKTLIFKHTFSVSLTKQLKPYIMKSSVNHLVIFKIEKSRGLEMHWTYKLDEGRNVEFLWGNHLVG